MSDGLVPPESSERNCSRVCWTGPSVVRSVSAVFGCVRVAYSAVSIEVIEGSTTDVVVVVYHKG